MSLFKIAEALAEAVYPAVCPVCREVLPHGCSRGLRIHPGCMAKLKKDHEGSEGCHGCVSGRSLWLYDEFSSEAMFFYKYDGRRELAAFFASAVLREYDGWIKGLGADAIVPVPISRKKMRSRGFNQSELIAEMISRSTGIPLNTKALYRVRSTSPQKALRAYQRRENLSRAFRAEEREMKGAENILLIDDIYTTGATIEHCARALKRAGAKRVSFLTVCRGQQD